MIRFGPDKDIDLSLAGAHLGKRYRSELLDQNTRARGLCDRLFRQDEPGCLLADEVGKGKTYVALAVAFASLARKPEGHVLILTHSRHMAGVWKDRWRELWQCVGPRWREWWDAGGWSSEEYRSVERLAEDAKRGCLPNIAFASYETLRKYGSESGDASHLLYALCRSEQFVGIRFRREERNALIKELCECDLRSVRPHELPVSVTKSILGCLDRNTRWWKEDADETIDDALDHVRARSLLKGGPRFDLLIVDEAHKLEGESRHRVVARLLHKRFDKCLHVTATPFALSVHQFRRRLLDFAHAWGRQDDFERSVRELPLDEFRKAVAERADYPQRHDLEKRLRRHMIRASWDHDRERSTEYWSEKAPAEALLPTLLLERVIDGVLQGGRRTHIASRRETLCSSWPAARKSLAERPLELADRRWAVAFEAAVSGRSAANDPKLRVAAKKLAELANQGTKVVVFTQRIETSKALARLLAENPQVKQIARMKTQLADRLGRHVDKVAQWLELDQVYAKGIVKVMAHSQDMPRMERRSVLRWWHRHKKRLGDGRSLEWERLQPIIGRGKRLPVVVRHDSDTGPDGRNVEKFNLPSAPLVLIATPRAQEGIDLHHYCRHVVLFDLTWNPSAMEQRIGRVHRLGGSRGRSQKVTVIYCYQKGTYEEIMAKRVQDRCEMMRVLLGAGQWLDEDREASELERYQMSFPA